MQPSSRKLVPNIAIQMSTKIIEIHGNPLLMRSTNAYILISNLKELIDMLLGSVWESAEFAVDAWLLDEVSTSRVGVWIGKNGCWICWWGFLVRLGGMGRSCVCDDMNNPLNEMLMHRSRQMTQLLSEQTNCLLQLVNPPTKRANYFNAWTCSSHMPMSYSIRTRNKARTKNHWWTKLVMEENLYYIGDSGSAECILVLLARCYLIGLLHLDRLPTRPIPRSVWFRRGLVGFQLDGPDRSDENWEHWVDYVAFIYMIECQVSQELSEARL